MFEQPVEIQLQALCNTPLGKLYQAVPFDSFVSQIPKPKPAISGKGCKPWFDVKGGVALQILKSYYRCSDALLAENINGNWQTLMFCGILIFHNEQIKGKDIAGRSLSYLGQHLDTDKLQMDCVAHWKPYMEHIHTGFTDATVYESYIERPTDA